MLSRSAAVALLIFGLGVVFFLPQGLAVLQGEERAGFQEQESSAGQSGEEQDGEDRKSYVLMPEPPLGYAVENYAITVGANPQPMPGDRVVLHSVMIQHQGDVNCAAQVQIDLRGFATEERRREAVQVNNESTAFAANRRGYKLLDSTAPDPESVELGKPIISSFDFEMPGGATFLVRKRLMFVDDISYTINVTSDDREALESVKAWADHIRPSVKTDDLQEDGAEIEADAPNDHAEGEQYYLLMPEPPVGYELAKGEIKHEDKLIGYALSLTNTKDVQARGQIAINFGNFRNEEMCRTAVNGQTIAPAAGAEANGYRVVASTLPDAETCDLTKPVLINYDFKGPNDDDHFIRKRLLFTSHAFSFDMSSTDRDEVEKLDEWASRIRPAQGWED